MSRSISKKGTLAEMSNGHINKAAQTGLCSVLGTNHGNDSSDCSDDSSSDKSNKRKLQKSNQASTKACSHEDSEYSSSEVNLNDIDIDTDSSEEAIIVTKVKAKVPAKAPAKVPAPVNAKVPVNANAKVPVNANTKVPVNANAKVPARARAPAKAPVPARAPAKAPTKAKVKVTENSHDSSDDSFCASMTKNIKSAKKSASASASVSAKPTKHKKQVKVKAKAKQCAGTIMETMMRNVINFKRLIENLSCGVSECKFIFYMPNSNISNTSTDKYDEYENKFLVGGAKKIKSDNERGGIYAQLVSDDRTMITIIKLNRLDEIECIHDEYGIGIDLKLFNKYLKRISNNKILTLSIKEDKTNILCMKSICSVNKNAETVSVSISESESESASGSNSNADSDEDSSFDSATIAKTRAKTKGRTRGVSARGNLSKNIESAIGTNISFALSEIKGDQFDGEIILYHDPSTLVVTMETLELHRVFVDMNIDANSACVKIKGKENFVKFIVNSEGNKMSKKFLNLNPYVDQNNIVAKCEARYALSCLISLTKNKSLGKYTTMYIRDDNPILLTSTINDLGKIYSHITPICVQEEDNN